ncbi:MAG: DUF4365 domain-containing protein [Bacteroidales bacterium]|nr:DUF4365 domain-containing protein [Bacteroidales bacterium]
MMTEENIKEALGLRFIEAIASKLGYKTNSVYPDHGTDLSIIEVDYREENGHRRYFDTGRELKIQVKSTTVNSIVWDDSVLKYDLEAKTYNDLIQRKNNQHPLLLVLFILPENNVEWLSLSAEELVIRKQAFWYFPDSTTLTSNIGSQRITLPRENIFSLETIDNLFENYAS